MAHLKTGYVLNSIQFTIAVLYSKYCVLCTTC